MNVEIGQWRRERHSVELTYRVAERVVTKRCSYDDVDFHELQKRYGVSLLDRVCGQLAMMEAIPFAGLAPAVIDAGAASRFLTPQFAQVWRTVVRKTGAQWRYERHLPDYDPQLRASAVAVEHPARIEGGNETPDDAFSADAPVLLFCGGGKDSLAALTLLRRARLPFGTFAYSHADYGAAEEQHALIDRVLDAARVERRHRMRAEDDAGELRARMICAETPISLFYAVPLLLQHGYRDLVLGNERSADSPNLQWEVNGEPVNHQWGKSAEAERLLNRYLRDELMPGGSYYSILKPLHDAVIVSLVRGETAVRQTHSCNVRKPWCERCAKCAYVWLTLAAYLPRETVKTMFTVDLLEVDANLRWFRELLGLDAHRPFECVGDVGEARLAFEVCRASRAGDERAERLANELPEVDLDDLCRRYLSVGDSSNIPAAVRARVLPLMEDAAREAQEYVRGVLSSTIPLPR